MIAGEKILTPYINTPYVPGTGGVHPVGGYHYKSPAGTLWNLDRIENNHAHLWTVNAWGRTYWESIDVLRFEREWTELRK